jgi:hypothetical protein
MARLQSIAYVCRIHAIVAIYPVLGVYLSLTLFTLQGAYIMTSVLLPHLIFASLDPPCTPGNHAFVSHFDTPFLLFLPRQTMQVFHPFM